MNLTNDEWEAVWREVKAIEEAFYKSWPPPMSGYRGRVKKAIIRLKGAVESVIGQMEWDNTALRGDWPHDQRR